MDIDVNTINDAIRKTNSISETKYKNSFARKTMCYATSDIFLRQFTETPLSITFFKVDTLINKLKSINNMPNILNIEILIKTAKSYNQNEKNKLIRKYNLNNYGYDVFVMKEDNLRLMLHAFNIIKYQDRFLINQSWSGICTYHNEFVYTTNEYFDFVDRLRDAIINFINDPRLFYGVFNQLDGLDENIVNMILREKFDVVTKFTIYYKP